jgi:hypothetical protein
MEAPATTVAKDRVKEHAAPEPNKLFAFAGAIARKEGFEFVLCLAQPEILVCL